LRGGFLKLKWIICFCLSAISGQVWSAENAVLKTDKEKLSYSIGASIGRNLMKDGTDINLNLLIKGLKTSTEGGNLQMSEQEIRYAMAEYQRVLRQHAMESRQQASIESRKKGKAYLAEYKAQKGVQALSNGVLYKIIKEGNGKKPTEADAVEVNYRGRMVNGKEFDATEPGRPANLKVASLIAGWKSALSAMPAGSKWQIVIPPELAYGDRGAGAGADIGPNEVLVFDVELISIE
jgi:FKBP-type peptidyl-prolyl cis-trans isomerase